MAKNIDQAFQSIRIVGGLLSSKVLQDARRYQLPGQRKEDYAIEPGFTFNEEMGRYWRIAQGRWKEFQQHIERKDLSSHSLAQQEWLLPLLTRVLGYDITPGVTKIIGEREFPITHTAHAGAVPLVLCGADFDLDKGDTRFGQEGRKRSPMGLAQEYVNAESHCLWAIVSNGRYLRLLRDNPAMTRPSYIEVDFTKLFEEDNYADFATVWLLLQATRLGPRNHQIEQCWLEQWREKGQDEGERALDKLRYGVADALRELGTGFVAHKKNQALRDKLSNGELSVDNYFQQVLRLVYRFLFLLTAEDRDVALLPKDHNGDDYTAARHLYEQGYAITLLRERARLNRHYDHHGDAWQQLLITFAGFARGQPLLAQPALGGLFAADQCEHLEAAELENRYLYRALFNLSYFEHNKTLSRINYRDMDTEEFGSVYESLLELIPQLSTEGRWQFSFMGDAADETAASGHSRKLTGSYYTPDSLVQELIKSALEPVLADRLKRNPQQPREAILSITVCDPACGSGHFLLAAARRLAVELARIDAGTDQPTEQHYRHAMHDVVRHCIYGVDLNPLAVELCKTGLWLESIEPGKPMSFLNAHIQNGNSLLGITKLNQISLGIPKDAFKALSGDENQLCKLISKTNTEYLRAFKKEKDSPNLSLALESSTTLTELLELENLPETTVDEIETKARAFNEHRKNIHDNRLKQAVDLYMGAFLVAKDGSVPEFEIPNSQNLYLALYTDQEPDQLASASQLDKINRARVLVDELKVFNWPLAFAQILNGPSKGFDCILGNPPWERIKLQEEEFFSTRSSDITDAKNKAERAQRIDWLSQGLLATHLYPDVAPSRDTSIAEQRLYQEFIQAKRTAEALSVFAHVSAEDGGRYPLTGVGDVNTYALFSETIQHVLSPRGRAGFIVPSGLATDNSTKDFFGALISRKSLHSFFEFENEGFFKGAGKGHMLRFALTTMLGSELSAPEASFMFQGKKVADLMDQERVFTLTAEDIERVNPNTLTCPIFQSRYDAELTKKIYQRVPVLIREAKGGEPEQNPWGIRFMAMFHMSNDSHLFKTYEELVGSGFSLDGNVFTLEKQQYLPLYEAKMIYIYSHRHGSFNESPGKRPHVLPRLSDEQLNCEYRSLPFYWIDKAEVNRLLVGQQYLRDWLIGWRDVTDARASARSTIPAVFPRYGAGNNLPLIMLDDRVSAKQAACLLANLSSIVLDYCARMKIGGLHLNYFLIKQFPLLSIGAYSSQSIEFIVPRVGYLTNTNYEMSGWARDLEINLRPIEFDLGKRAVIQAELDAFFAHLYCLSREELQFILDPESIMPGYPSETFAVLKRNEHREFGEYRTQRLVLEAWDKLERGELH